MKYGNQKKQTVLERIYTAIIIFVFVVVYVLFLVWVDQWTIKNDALDFYTECLARELDSETCIQLTEIEMGN